MGGSSGPLAVAEMLRLSSPGSPKDVVGPFFIGGSRGKEQGAEWPRAFGGDLVREFRDGWEIRKGCRAVGFLVCL